MTAPRQRTALALALLAALAGCQRGAPSGGSPAPSASAAGGGSARAAARASSEAAEPPGPFDRLRDRLVAEARGLQGPAEALVQAAERRDDEGAKSSYRELRRRYRRIEPAGRLMAKVASSQLGAYQFFEPEEAGFTGLPAASRLLGAGAIDHGALLGVAKKLRQAARLLPEELSTQRWGADRVGLSLSSGAFNLGARLDGSDSLDEGERWGDVEAETAGLLEALDDVLGEIEKHDPEAAQAARREAATLAQFREKAAQPGGPARVGALAVLRSTGRLGAALRKGFGAAGGGVLSPPFRPRHDRGRGPLAEVSALTFPALLGEAPRAAEVALGRALFSSKLLSRSKDIACASCHDEKFGFARPDPPTQTFEHKAPPRNAPGLWNTAYETFFFWDGRASTLDTQINVAVDRDMGGDWGEVERRVNADATLKKLADEQALTGAQIRHAIVAYERTLIEDQTRLDRHERGEIELGDDEQRGFDLFFGKARCSRCHRLPLLSGVQPPRFLRAELSAIGAPTRPTGKDPGADPGRASITHRDRDRGLFKVPGLRRVADTAPYFHHGGFATLDQVLSFYEKGGGPGLGVEVPNADPELRPAPLASDERAALLLFLKKTLGR